MAYKRNDTENKTDSLFDESLKIIRGVKKINRELNDKNYNFNIRKSLKAILNSEFTRDQGEKVALVDMMCTAVCLNVTKTGNARDLQAITKIVGELNDDVNLNIGGIEKYLKPVEDKEEF